VLRTSPACRCASAAGSASPASPAKGADPADNAGSDPLRVTGDIAQIDGYLWGGLRSAQTQHALRARRSPHHLGSTCHIRRRQRLRVVKIAVVRPVCGRVSAADERRQPPPLLSMSRQSNDYNCAPQPSTSYPHYTALTARIVGVAYNYLAGLLARSCERTVGNRAGAALAARRLRGPSTRANSNTWVGGFLHSGDPAESILSMLCNRAPRPSSALSGAPAKGSC